MASNQRPSERESTHLWELTQRAYDVAREAAGSIAQGLPQRSPDFVQAVREREEELDSLDREINEGVTTAITHCTSELEARELLACLKLIIELERIGDLMLSFANRARSIFERLEEPDLKDLSTMAVLLEKMLTDAAESFRSRNTDLALAVLRADSEMDRLRNLLFVRHIENPENQPQQEGFHVVFMSQALERAGDHTKNLAEEVVQLVTGRSVRHLLRAQDKPDEVRFLEFMRNRAKM